MPQGSLIPIPGVPTFSSTEAAMRWAHNEAGDLLNDMQFMVVKVGVIADLRRKVKPELVVNVKPRKAFDEDEG